MDDNGSKNTGDEIPAQFRKTKSGKWAVMGPVDALEKALAGDGMVDVQKKSGDWSTFKIFSLGRPFDVDGTEMCYGYGPDEDDGKAKDRPASTTPPKTSKNAAPRSVDNAPPPDPSEPLPEYQGGPDDEWVDF